MTLTMADFGTFFAAIHAGNRPFAWQERLLRDLVESGRWPDRIVAPTGAGKTAVIDVHVFAVALMAAGSGPRVPRRLALVVDRRALVDSQFELARHVNATLRDAGDDGILGEVRRHLASLRSGRGDHRDPLVVTMLRGGVPPSRRWVDDPSAPAILCATPAMWGSRLLFRGYGSGVLARPREAGLLAYDSVLVVDEAHLARQLVATARRIDALEAMATDPLPMSRVAVVEASATIDGDPTMRSVAVSAADLAPGSAGGDVLAERLARAKPVTLVPSPVWPASSTAARSAIARLMADEADALLALHGRTIACVTNTVSGALAAATELRTRGRTVELLVGRMRPHDIAALRRRRPGLLSIDGDPDVDVVVATQTIEVGIDADFSAMVTELAAGSALAQRAGRVNRLGRRASTGVRIIVPEGGAAAIGPKGAPPYETDELTGALGWIIGRAACDTGLAPFEIAADPPPPAVLRRLVLGRPEPWDAAFLARTSDALFAEPDLELWLSDDLELDTDVSVVVRAGLTGEATSDLPLLRATPPRAAECFPVSIGRLRELLERDAGKTGPTYRWRADEVAPLDEGSDLAPGDVIVVGERVAWFTHGVVDPAGTECATDVLEDERDGEPALLRIGAGTPIDVATHGRATDELLASLGEVLETHPADGRARRTAIADLLGSWGNRQRERVSDDAHRRLSSVAHLLRRRLADAAIEIGPIGDRGMPAWVVIVDARRQLVDEEVRQTWSGSLLPVSLDAHQADVADRAAELAVRLGLGDEIERALHHAGAMHDEAGKRDPRFQRLLRGDEGASVSADDGIPIAKSGRRTPAAYRAAIASSGLPSGWRHEQLSAVVAWERTGDGLDRASRLVTRLVGTSHGRGRATFPHATGGLLPDGHGLVDLSAALHDEGTWDALVEATHRAHGTWGCAYLEAILRAADGQVSGEADERA